MTEKMMNQTTIPQNTKRKRTPDPSIIRVDDHIKIIIPEAVERVGYPLTKKKIIDAMTYEQLGALNKCLSSTFGVDLASWNGLLPADGTSEEIINVIAGMMLRKQGWGGNKKTIHIRTINDLKDQVFRVYQKKVVKTGIYTPGWSGYDSYSCEYDCEPAYLDNEKTHVLYGIIPAITFEPVIWSENNLIFFERRCVQKVTYNPYTGNYE